ncbi:hypothetical protein K443DRAFT_548158 [Laccaria amethystina LaAM-08-1]|uniref:Uncharacterized protein n=1 Tax=Laccaria amethystina LaAM-08-1 TaxID=1095629 RepID=A0A0C9XJX8_9AGAR|nr:hypothetical protein K443DRAFT_548158 [Laccaria amethystina LaAM-08-1]
MTYELADSRWLKAEPYPAAFASLKSTAAKNGEFHGFMLSVSIGARTSDDLILLLVTLISPIAMNDQTQFLACFQQVLFSCLRRVPFFQVPPSDPSRISSSRPHLPPITNIKLGPHLPPRTRSFQGSEPLRLRLSSRFNESPQTRLRS